jgi:hypothetical protein
MTTVEQEMERLCEMALKSARSNQSHHRITPQKSPPKKNPKVPPLPMHKLGSANANANQPKHRKTQS